MSEMTLTDGLKGFSFPASPLLVEPEDICLPCLCQRMSVLLWSGFIFGPTTTAGSWSARPLFTSTMPCRTFRTCWLMKTCFPRKQVKKHLTRTSRLCRLSPSPLPSLAGSVFPTGFVFLVQKVFLLFFRTLAHIYWSHYKEMLVLGLHPHLNTLFTHLTLFCRQHALLELEDTEPLQDLITALGQ